MKVIEATHDHLDSWLKLRQELWPDPDAVHLQEMQALLASELATAFLLFDSDEHAVGFIEGMLYLGGSPTYGYVEGWYVAPAYRRQGWGRRLLTALEQWILHHSISLVLSDTVPTEYPLSVDAHHKNGYSDLMTIQVFIKRADFAVSGSNLAGEVKN